MLLSPPASNWPASSLCWRSLQVHGFMPHCTHPNHYEVLWAIGNSPHSGLHFSTGPSPICLLSKMLHLRRHTWPYATWTTRTLMTSARLLTPSNLWHCSTNYTHLNQALQDWPGLWTSWVTGLWLSGSDKDHPDCVAKHHSNHIWQHHCCRAHHLQQQNSLQRRGEETRVLL